MGFLGTFLKRLFSPRSARELLPIGSRAPDFSVQDHTGRVVRLADFAGRRVVLWFYPKASTPG
jgi:peroxiredoxin